jgi:hypothetical protein
MSCNSKLTENTKRYLSDGTVNDRGVLVSRWGLVILRILQIEESVFVLTK